MSRFDAIFERWDNIPLPFAPIESGDEGRLDSLLLFSEQKSKAGFTNEEIDRRLTLMIPMIRQGYPIATAWDRAGAS
jgi:hypothetical protein